MSARSKIIVLLIVGSSLILVIILICLLKHIMIKSLLENKLFLVSYSVPPPILGPPPSVYYSKHNLSTPSTTSSQPWFLDTGATHHLTGDKSILQAPTPYTGHESMMLGNEQFIPISTTDHSFLSRYKHALLLKELLHAL